VGVNCSLTQLLDSGFYHADPHPGNLMRTPDGKLAYLDFGMMGEMKENLRDGLIEASLHLVNREFDELASDFVTLGLLPPTAEMGALSQALTGTLPDFYIYCNVDLYLMKVMVSYFVCDTHKVMLLFSSFCFTFGQN
jgi:aarF domain-containing kinase